ncbi:hypothetical protein RRF57_001939 [Xylaria bambusicola]|uniref:Uncharacterized protein n=1 Tax=Xylaria bambusicola TaxID=326684 RepID=A0AAN7URV7_9PEZI
MIREYMLALIGLVAVAWFILAIRNHASPKLNFPVVGSPTDRDFSKALVEGYAKVRGATRMRTSSASLLTLEFLVS